MRDNKSFQLMESGRICDMFGSVSIPAALTSFSLGSGDVDDEGLQLRAGLVQLLDPRLLRLPVVQQVLKG